MAPLDCEELRRWLDDASRSPPVLLDVRESWEYRYCHIDGSQWMPMGEVPQRCRALDPTAEIVLICHHGIRSYQVGILLAHNGFTRIYNLRGGVEAWARQVDPAMPRY